jgi:hypothetical protein
LTMNEEVEATKKPEEETKRPKESTLQGHDCRMVQGWWLVLLQECSRGTLLLF